MDFLDRLVERQRDPLAGVRPILPTRYEPAPEPLREVEEREVVAPPATRQPLSSPSPRSPRTPGSTRATEASADPVVTPAPAAPAHPSGADRSRRQASRPSDAALRAPEAEVALLEEAVTADARPRAVQPHVAEAAPRSAPAHLPPPALLCLTTGDAPSAAVLPPPMLPARTRAPDTPPAPEARAGRQDAPGRPATVSISIGRIEIQATGGDRGETAHPRLEAPVTSPRPTYQPRLSLDDYLQRPHRGRS